MELVRRAGAARHWFERGVELQTGESSSTLLIAFGGLGQGLKGGPRFEFRAVTRDIPVKKLFVRDPRQAWYHLGISRHGRSFEELAKSLERLVAGLHAERIVTTGASMGGYAALAFGTLLGADAVIAIAPQTVIDVEVMRAMGDRRYERRLGQLAAARRLDPKWIDLKSALPDARHSEIEYRIYFSEPFRIDRLHAERMEGISGLRLFRFGRGAHGLALSLRDSGAMTAMLRQAVRLG